VGGQDGQGGLQARAVPGGASAAYFNPALLSDAKTGFTFGFVVAHTDISVGLEGRPSRSFDVPDDVANATRSNGDRWDQYPLPTKLLEDGRPADRFREAVSAHPRQAAGSGHDTVPYAMIGLVGKLFQGRLTGGFYALIPAGDFTTLRASYADEREQYFSNSLHPELYGDRMRALSLAGGAAWRFSDQLSLGAAATLSLRANVGAPAYVADASRLQDLLLTSDAKVNVSVSPHFGVSYLPTPRFRLSGTVHTPQKVELGASFTFLLASGYKQASSVTWIHDYMPWQFGLGASYDFYKAQGRTFTVVGSAVYGTWSNYVDRQGETPLPAYTWRDTITGTAGARFQLERVGTFVDLQYKPTPVPLQTGITNYVDNDRLGASVGADYAFEFLGTSFRLGAQMQSYLLLARHQAKLPTPTFSDGENRTPQVVRDEVPDDAQRVDEPVAGREGLQTNNPGWPGFSSSGWVLGGGVYLSIAM
jgi:hypothetical protein